MDIRTMLGQRLAFGIIGPSLSDEKIELIRKYRIGNVLLFRENVTDGNQLRALCRSIQDLILETTGIPAFIAVDQEGGMVSRLSADLVNVPGNMAVAAAGKPETARRMAAITARQLRGTGINFNLAPAVDVNNNSRNPVIGVRSYGDDPDLTAEYAVSAVRGYAENCLLCCAKHFPGHGRTDVDSHIALPVVNRSLRELWETELIPFRAVIDAGVPAVMSSHILFPQIEPKEVPSTMSRRIMHDLLREEMGFGGLILSDDLNMDAIRMHYGISHGAVEAMKAGVDLIIVCNCNDEDAEQKCAEEALKAAESGEISMDEMEDSVSRILEAKSEYAFTMAEPELAGWPEDFSAARETACAAAVLYQGPCHPFLEDTFFCGPKDYRMTNAANTDLYASDFAHHMRERFGAAGITCSVDPDTAEIMDIVSEAKKHRNLVMGTCNAHLYRRQLALAEALAETGLPLTVIALRNPYDLSELPENVCKISVFDYTLDGLNAAEQVLLSGRAAGRMPVRL